MSERILIRASAQEFFHEMVKGALSQQRLDLREATEFYVVNLLAQHLAEHRSSESPEAEREPLALILKRALEGDREARFRNLKKLGDTSLFVSGFFGDSLARSPVSVQYYMSMGERAYGALSTEPRTAAGAQEVFAELAERFPDVVDVLAEIAELADLRSNRGLLKLYERFLLTGSERVAQRLRERGVALFAGPARRRGGLES